jgi:hypothetical protein
VPLSLASKVVSYATLQLARIAVGGRDVQLSEILRWCIRSDGQVNSRLTFLFVDDRSTRLPLEGGAKASANNVVVVGNCARASNKTMPTQI